MMMMMMIKHINIGHIGDSFLRVEWANHQC